MGDPDSLSALQLLLCTVLALVSHSLLSLEISLTEVMKITPLFHTGFTQIHLRDKKCRRTEKYDIYINLCSFTLYLIYWIIISCWISFKFNQLGQLSTTVYSEKLLKHIPKTNWQQHQLACVLVEEFRQHQMGNSPEVYHMNFRVGYCDVFKWMCSTLL